MGLTFDGGAGQPLVVGYRHTGIITKDIQKSTNFYSSILGLKIIQDFTDDSEYINKITGIENGVAHFVKLQGLDGFVLELLEYPSHPSEPLNASIINVGILHIALRVRDAETTYKELVRQGVTVLSEPVLSSEGIAKVFFCLDPDNVRVEMVEMIL
jgi:catechol 2,3-dioxygenase-like lactoylglutathione lyase family enzyme